MNPIIEVQKEKEINYSQKIIENFWVQLNINSSKKQDRGGISWNGNLEKITDCIHGISETLCIYSNEFSPEILNAILSISQKIRVYLLTNDWDSKKQELKNLSENCLIRVLNTRYQGSFILSDIHSNFRGYYFNGSFLTKHIEDNNRYLLLLDKEQKDFFFQLFCEWFWKEANWEILTKEQVENPLKVESQPFDFLFSKPNYISSIGIESILKDVTVQNSNWLISLNKIDKNAERIFKNSNSLTLYTSLKNNEISSLNCLSIKNKLYALNDYQSDNHLEIITNHNDTSYIINRKENEEFGWIFPLTQNQTRCFSDALQSIGAAYEYKQQDNRINLKNKKLYLLERKEDKVIQETEEIPLKDIRIDDLKTIDNKEDFTSKEPNDFTDPLWAAKAVYKWKIVPPSLRNNLNKDSLYNHWEEAHRKIYGTISNLISKVEDINNEESVFAKFTGLFKPSGLKEIKKELESKKQKLESKKLGEYSEQERLDLKLSLENIQKEIEEHKKNKIKNIEEYKNKKQEELKNLKSNKTDIESSIKKIKQEETEIESIDKEIEGIEKEIKQLENKIQIKTEKNQPLEKQTNKEEQHE